MYLEFLCTVEKSLYFEDKQIADKPIKEVMGPPYPVVRENVAVDKISSLIHKNNQAVIVDSGNGHYHMITKHDIISVIH